MKNEILTTNNTFRIEKFTYQTADEAIAVFDSFSDPQKKQMAEVYQNAFGGEPWLERFSCPGCGAYVVENRCAGCSKNDLPEAYPLDELVNTTFPKMLEAFTPGVLLASYEEDDTISGISTGGFTTVDALVDAKYNRSETILFSIKQEGAVSDMTNIFYDNETCIDPKRQKNGLGKKFSQERIQSSISLGADTVCGRTINQPWLALKERQLNENGYQVISFVPDGDTYAVNGIPRTFYIAKRTL